jgi:hypothetical protein
MTKKHDDEHDEHTPKAEPVAITPKAAAPPQPFPYTASINEPQTVSLPLPPNVTVPKPVISGYEPYDCTIGDPDFTLYISGENFFADSVIHFAGHDEPTTLNEDGRLSTGVKPSLWAEPVTVQVQIKNGPEISAPVEFEFLAPAARSRRK